MSTLKTIKIIHTFIWLIMVWAIFYILYAGITNTFNATLLFSIGLVSLETIVLAFNKWTCPLTPWAGKYTKNRDVNFDIYLPRWLAKYNKVFFGTLFIFGLALIAINLIRN